MIYKMTYKTWFSKTFSYNNCEKLQSCISRHYRNLEGYGNWKFFITLHDLCVKKISSISEMVVQKLCQRKLDSYRNSLLKNNFKQFWFYRKIDQFSLTPVTFCWYEFMSGPIKALVSRPPQFHAHNSRRLVKNHHYMRLFHNICHL